MNLKEIKNLLTLIEKSNVKEVQIQHPKIKLLVKKDFSKVSH
jgi:hypothetical protein